MAKTRISKLRVHEVSLVDRPANPSARLLLAKRAPEETETVEKCATSGCKHDAMDGSQYCADHAKMHKRADDAIELGATLDVAIESAMQDDTLTPQQRSDHIAKSVAEYQASILELDNLPSPDAREATTINTEEGTVEKNDKEVDVLKALSPEAKAAVEKLLSDATKDLGEKLEKAQKTADDTRIELAKRDRLAKAEKLVKGTSYKAEDVAKVFEKANDDTDIVAAYSDLLAKYAKAIEVGRVLGEVGSDYGDQNVGAESEIEKAVVEIRKAEPKLTYAQAYSKAIMTDPALYEATLKNS